MNYFEKKEDKATVLEYLSNVQEMIKEYLNKPAKSSRTPNNSEPSTTGNFAKPTSNNEASTSSKTDDSIQHSPDDWSEDYDDTERKGRLDEGFTDLGSYLRSNDQLQTSRNKQNVWDGIAASLRDETGNLTISGE